MDKGEGFDSASLDTSGRSKIKRVFPKKTVGYEVDGTPIEKRVCSFCDKEFVLLPGDSATNIGRHLKGVCMGKNTDPNSKEFPSQLLLTNSTLNTADLLEMKAQEYFDKERFKTFLVELDKRAKSEGLQTPEKKIGRTPKKLPRAGNSSKVRVVKRNLMFDTQGEPEEENVQEDGGNDTNFGAAALPIAHQEIRNIVRNVLEEIQSELLDELNSRFNRLETKFDELDSRFNRMESKFNEVLELLAQHQPKSSKKKGDKQKVAETAATELQAPGEGQEGEDCE